MFGANSKGPPFIFDIGTFTKWDPRQKSSFHYATAASSINNGDEMANKKFKFTQPLWFFPAAMVF